MQNFKRRLLIGLFRSKIFATGTVGGSRSSISCGASKRIYDKPHLQLASTVVGFCFAVQVFSAGISFSEEEAADLNEEDINIYLKADSRDLLEKFGDANQISSFSSPGRVRFLKNVNSRDRFVYSPLFGQRAAFRLKGLLLTSEGDVVAVGRVSSMVGELKESGYEVSLLLTSANAPQGHQNMLLDLPTRLSRVQSRNNAEHWKGHLPSGSVRGTYYSGLMFVTYTPLHPSSQIVIEGVLCSNMLVGEDGSCDYDHSQEPSNPELEAEVQSSLKTSASSSTNPSSGDEEEADECPVCRYIKAGPCKIEFLMFDDCMQKMEKDDDILKCAPATTAMMKCFQQHEYYDIMVAGFDMSKLERAE